jgi:ribosomal protein L12E/L44/L45/RPP1/RPP2
MNIDPNMLDPEMMKNFINSFSNMSDEELKNVLKSIGIDADPSMVRQTAEMFKNADKKDFENLKQQYEVF